MPLTGTGNGAEYALLPTGVGRDSSQESEPDRDVEAEPLLQPEPEPQPGSPQRGGLQLPEEVAAAISRGQAPDAPPPQDSDAGEADEPDPALAFVEFLSRNKIAKPCRRKCGQCKRKARLCAALLRDEDLPLLPDDLRMQQEQLRAQSSAMVEKETRREAILQHWQEDVGDEDEDNFEATLAKMKEEMAQDTR